MNLCKLMSMSPRAVMSQTSFMIIGWTLCLLIAPFTCLKCVANFGYHEIFFSFYTLM